MTGNEALEAVTAINIQLTKASNEITAKIGELEAALANQTLSPQAEQALADLKAQAQALDDIVPDVPQTGVG